MERRIQRPLLHLQHILRGPLDHLGDGMTMSIPVTSVRSTIMSSVPFSISPPDCSFFPSPSAPPLEVLWKISVYHSESYGKDGTKTRSGGDSPMRSPSQAVEEFSGFRAEASYTSAKRTAWHSTMIP